MPSPTPSLRAADVLDAVRESCFGSPGAGRVGVEVELLTFPAGDPRHRLCESELRTAAAGARTASTGRITLEPGGQIELSSRTYDSVGEAIEATATDVSGLRRSLLDSGIATAALGHDPARHARRILDHPRYEAMESFFVAHGSGGPGRHAAPFGRDAGLTMMCNTASVQVNVDLGAADGMAARWRLAHTLGPTLVATFANSPYIPVAAPDQPIRSARQLVWWAIDRSRTADALSAAEPAEAWANYALDAAVMFIPAQADRFEPPGERMTFRTWLDRGHPLGYPTHEDVTYHLTTLFPPVRPRGWLELRYLDALPDPWWRVAAAVTVALLDDPPAAAVAEAACHPVRAEWIEAASLGLAHPGLAAASRACFRAALEALPRIGCDDLTAEAAAEYLARYVERDRTPADDLLARWTAAGNGAERLVADPLASPAPVS